MCGILGFVASPDSNFNLRDLRSLTDRLLWLSESRGKDASGLVLADASRIVNLKRPVRGKSLIKTKEYIALLREFEQSGSARLPETIVAMGHTRMVTNGSAAIHENNQPVFKQGMLCFHNGIVVNDNDVWQKFFTGGRQYEVDTEIILSMIAYYRQKEQPLVEAVRSTFNHLIMLSGYGFDFLYGKYRGHLRNRKCREVDFQSKGDRNISDLSVS